MGKGDANGHLKMKETKKDYYQAGNSSAGIARQLDNIRID